MSLDKEKVRPAIAELVKSAYFLGLAAGSGREVFEDGQIYSYAELNARFEKADNEVGDLLGIREEVEPSGT